MMTRPTRRVFIARSASLAAGATTLSVLGAGFRPTVASAHEVAGNANRAVEIYNAMQKYFYLPDSKLYLETHPQKNSNPYAYLWPFYEALAGTLDMAGLPQIGGGYTSAVQDRLAALKFYYRNWSGTAPGASITYNGSGYDSYPRGLYGSGGDRYNDDNAWVGRALVQLHRMAGSSSLLAGGLTPLQGAADVFQFLRAGWDSTTQYPHSGGEFWVQATWNRDRGTGPTGGLAKLALHLRELTGDPAYQDWALRAYDWVRANLYRTDNVYADKVLPDGTIDWGVWSYNQGVMIGAGVLLTRLTGSTSYRDQAVITADAALDYFNRVGWYSQPVIFNVLFFRNLLLLCDALKSVDPPRASSYLGAVQSFADRVWNDTSIHKKQTHLIKFDPSTSAYKLREQAAMVQIYACLAWSNDSYSKLT
jgi:hypothetical protein